MRILIVKKKNSCYPFVEEQADALRKEGVECEFFLIEGTGLKCYLRALAQFRRFVKINRPDVIHAHYGLSGLLANMQRFIPVVTTYHGSDINRKSIRIISAFTALLSSKNLFVSKRLLDLSWVKKQGMVLPCGINIDDFPFVSKQDARKAMHLSENRILILFSSDFHTVVKNAPLALHSVERIDNAELIELNGYTRAEVNLLMHAADVCLMTSFSEGSPQFVKEALVCGTPIVTTPVGDTSWVIGDTEGCYFSQYSVEDCTNQLRKAIHFAQQKDRTNGKKRILELRLNNNSIAQDLVAIYEQVKHN